MFDPVIDTFGPEKPYLSLRIPIKSNIGHGYIHLGMKAYKAVSENAMHSSLWITDQFYGGLAVEELEVEIVKLSDSMDISNESNQEVIELLL